MYLARVGHTSIMQGTTLEAEMKGSLLALCVMLAAFLPTTMSAQGAPGCGADDVKFDVSAEKPRQPIGKPDMGKALIVFLQDDDQFGSRPRPTTRFGIDGTWIGATSANSYFSVTVEPGEHHLCAKWQNFVGFTFGAGMNTAAAHFTAEPGGIYFFVARDRYNEHDTPPEVKLSPLDSDEGQLMTGKLSLVASRPKK
jgi:hypothetical protein